MKTLSKLAVVSVIGLGLAGTTALSASWGDCPGYGYGHGRGHMHGNPGQRWEMMQQHHAERMELLEHRLQLKPDQKAVWQAFVDAQTTHRNTMHGGPRQRQQQGQVNVPEYFNNRVQFMEQRLTSLQDMAKAASDLYATLTPEQQKMIDDFLASRPGYGRKGGAASN